MVESYWRNTARSVKIGPISAWSLVPLLLLVFIHSVLLLELAVVFVILLGIAEYFGWSLATLARYVRARIAGKRVARRKMIFNHVIE